MIDNSSSIEQKDNNLQENIEAEQKEIHNENLIDNEEGKKIEEVNNNKDNLKSDEQKTINKETQKENSNLEEDSKNEKEIKNIEKDSMLTSKKNEEKDLMLIEEDEKTKENEKMKEKEKILKLLEEKQKEQQKEKELEKDLMIEEEKKERDVSELEEQIDYKYNEKGELIHKQTGQKCGNLNFKEYQLVGMYVQKYVEKSLIEKFNLITLYVPNTNSTDFTKRDESHAQCKILITKDFSTNPKCLMLIQGTGAVRLGQWARSVCINDNIYIGSMIPYVEKAIKNNFSVIIYNPNERKDFEDNEKIIKEFRTMEQHSVYVYNNIVKTNENIKEIYIVAHSMGGSCTVDILLNNKQDLLNGKIKKIAFTDSVHGENYKKLGKEGIEIFRNISRNYVGSEKPAGEFVRDYSTSYGGVDCYSSGHSKHVYTSGYAIEEVFKFFNSEN